LDVKPEIAFRGGQRRGKNMKKTFTFLTALLLGVALHNASAVTGITVDENGNWSTTDLSILSWTSATPPGPPFAPAGLLQTLDYALPFQVTKGAVLIYEDPAQTILSDVIWFDGPLDPNSHMYFYSDNTDGSDSLADQNGVPSPTINFGVNTVKVTEQGMEGDNGYFNYTPTTGMPGFNAGGVTYNFISDVPEPTTIGLVAIGLLGVLTIRRRKVS
jgi:hypothetical protein